MSGNLGTPTKPGYLKLADLIEAGDVTWEGFCAALRESGALCGDLVTAASVAAYPYCLQVLRGGEDARGPTPPDLHGAVAALSDAEFRDPIFRASVIAAALGELSDAEVFTGSTETIPAWSW